jgi:hypothetical protein
MASPQETSDGIGPTHLRFGDIVVVLALLALLLYAAWKQFPVYTQQPGAQTPSAQTAHQP